MKYCLSLLFFSAVLFGSSAQEKNDLQAHSFSVPDLSADEFLQFIKPKIAQSQFVFLGEQHGIVEVGEMTSALFELAQPYGFNTLCLETDAIAAKTIAGFYESNHPKEMAIKLNQQYHFSIPFYNNAEDLLMFEKVLKAGSELWGIDQTLMTQFRLNFDYIIRHTSNELLKKKLIPLLASAEQAFAKTIQDKDFMAPYIFKYDEATHQELMTISQNAEEKEILYQLWKTKEIYGYNFSGEYYRNNEMRARLMKRNFMKYYRAAQQQTAVPKVLFKLGAYHAMKGFTDTNILDISNLGAELAVMNELESLHLMVMGISGSQNRANPFEPDKAIVPIDVSDDLPKELMDLTAAAADKYLIIDAKSLRPQLKKFSADLKKLLLKYDVIILIKEARAYTAY